MVDAAAVEEVAVIAAAAVVVVVEVGFKKYLPYFLHEYFRRGSR